ncbi:hypothetical protein BGZ83_007337 [Gryganskiella cystojenkinii]|nr:hypothetical protein BGZ83_007337 [Gryganskiella cystojenkinii]
MVKVTSIFIAVAATMVAAVANSAPVVPSSPSPTIAINETIVAIPTPVQDANSTATATAVETMTSESTVSIAASTDPFSTSVHHQGKATWFTHHYGACNHYWNGYKEPVVALNAHQMGAMSWGNPVCSRRVRVTNKDHPERSVVARIVDKCPGDECAWGSLDLSPFAFKRLGHLDTGVLNITWSYV